MVSMDGPAADPSVETSLEDSLRQLLLSREAITFYELAHRLRTETRLLKNLLDEWILNEKVECLFPVIGRDDGTPDYDGRDGVFYRWKRERDTSQLWQLKYARDRSRSRLPRSTDRAFLY